MIDYKIHISDEADIQSKQLIADYWLFENNEFVYNLHQLSEKHDVPLNKVSNLIKKYSRCEITEKCEKCDKMFPRIAETKGFFKRGSYYDTICPEWEAEEERLDQLERERRRQERERLAQEMIEQRSRIFEEALERKAWRELNFYEMDVLNKIIACGMDLKLVKKNVFNNNFYDKTVWKIVNKIERLDLVSVVRNGYGSVVNIEWDRRLPSLLEGSQTTDSKGEVRDYYGFSLHKSKNQLTPRHPYYSGTFTLETDIVLRANVKYIYGGWVQTDGSITLKFTPHDKIVKYPVQTSIEEEDESIRNVLDDMCNDLDRLR